MEHPHNDPVAPVEGAFKLLLPELQRAVADAGYQTPTPIQEQSIASLLEGRDMLGCAQTGTGKTAAFTLPILQYLQHHKHRAVSRRPRVLVLAPTRELAAQIGQSVAKYGKHTRTTHTVIFGGVGQHPQVTALHAGRHIAIATPGRLLDLLNQGFVDLGGVEIFVLDEADRMLDMGFINDIKKIIAKLPAKRQSLFFSATMEPEVKALAASLVRNPVHVTIDPDRPAVERIVQKVMFVDRKDKDELLVNLMGGRHLDRVIVFTQMKHVANKVCQKLAKAGIGTAAIHGNKSQGARTQALHDFKTGRIRVLVATDIAARGIDVEGISHVINYDVPRYAEDYIHRIGRTGRAGAEGLAVSLVANEEAGLLRDIRRLLKQDIAIEIVGGFEPVQPLRLEGPGSNGRPTFGKPQSHARRPHPHAPNTKHAAAKKQHRQWRGDRSARKA
jgi:ATP-dependent RNA helicase RhlE